jgi:hypothetical protein
MRRRIDPIRRERGNAAIKPATAPTQDSQAPDFGGPARDRSMPLLRTAAISGLPRMFTIEPGTAPPRVVKMPQRLRHKKAMQKGHTSTCCRAKIIEQDNCPTTFILSARH